MLFTALDGALLDGAGSTSASQQARAELDRQRIPWILMTSRTRAELDPLRRKLEHAHPFVAENGGGLFIPDGYFNVRIPGAERFGRNLCVPIGRPVQQIREALDEIAAECGVEVTGFHDMSPREIAGNLGVNPREAELAARREFEEPFFFTSADDEGIARFIALARDRGFQARSGTPFWHFSSGSDFARAARILMDLFKQSTHSKLRALGIGSAEEDLPWLRAMTQAVLLPSRSAFPAVQPNQLGRITLADAPGPSGWNSAALQLIR